MIRLLIEKELKEVINSTKFAITFGVCSLLIMLSFYVGAKNYQLWSRQYEAARSETLTQLQGLTDWFNVQQHTILLPPQPLAALVSGISNDIGRTFEVHGRGQLNADDSRFNEDPIFAVFRFLDLDFIFQIVLSLFAMLFAYDSVAGERERGTLKLTFAHPVPKDTYILGKLFGSFLGLGLPLLIPVLAGCLLLPAFGVPMKADEWTRLAIIIAAGFLYFGVFLTISIFISTLTRHSSSAFLLLLIVWILSVIIIPRTAVLIAGRAVEVPSVDEMASQKNRYSSQLWAEDRKKLAAFDSNPANTEPQKVMEEFNKLMQNIADERDKKMQEFTARLDEQRDNQQRVQQQLALSIARISPTAAFSLAASSIAGTSLTLEHHYRDEALEYQKAFAGFLMAKNGMVAGGRMVMMRNVVGSDKKPEPINPHDLPEFTYKPMKLPDVLGAGMVGLGLLGIFNLIFFLGSYVAFLRYDVR